jgi:hypothetical protein
MNRASLVQICFGAVLTIVLVRACVVFEPLPGWDANPLETPSAIVGIGPAGYLLLDAAALVLAGVVCVLVGHKLNWIAVTALLGCLGIVVHTLAFARGDAEPLPVAGAWASGAAVLAAASAVGSRPALRRAGTAIVMGSLCILLAKGAGQMLIEHPSVVATFDENPEAALAARGYTPGSAAALQFERRLRQPDITAWFGLSNVLAAYLAAGAVACLALCWQSRNFARDWAWLTAAGVGLACWLGVYVSGSKAGLAIAGAGSAALLVSQMVRSKLGNRPLSHLVARACGVSLWLLPLAAICGRAVLLPPEGELSLLFRWFYLDSAVDIAKASLPGGTGVDGFRAAYAVAKPPIAPETVTSSHNALTDWAAMLGVFGIPLIVVVAASAWLIASGLGTRQPETQPSTPNRATMLSFGLVLSMPVVVGAYSESSAALIELAVLRVLGLGLAVATAAAVWRLRAGRIVTASVAIVLLAHSQIDMLLFHPGSIPLAMCAVGLAVPAGRIASWKRWSAAVPAACAVALAVLAVTTWRWESSLRNAFAAAQTIAVSAEQARGGNASARAELPGLVRRLAPRIRDELRTAAEAMPRDARAWLAMSDLELSLGPPGPEAWNAAVAATEADASVRTLGRLASLAEAFAERAEGGADRTVWIERARNALGRAVARDPHGPHFAARRADLEAREGDAGAARAWAARALQSDANYALDPLARLPRVTRDRLEAITSTERVGEDGAKDAPPGS